jgi:hypothetical protein
MLVTIEWRNETGARRKCSVLRPGRQRHAVQREDGVVQRRFVPRLAQYGGQGRVRAAPIEP